MVERAKTHSLEWIENGLVLRKVRSETRADSDALRVTLFRGAAGSACGWYIGPLGTTQGRFSLPYLPRSEETMASVAIVRAIEVARETRDDICLVDPDDLWDSVWNG